MKKLYFLFSLLIVSTVALAQSQRLVLMMEFTNASCPPCAADNPAFNSLINANATKCVGIKFQASFPGTDPMYTQDASQITTEQNLYGINSVPRAIIDGNVYNGLPTGVTQTSINSRYAVPSPFMIMVTHRLSPAHDSIFVHEVLNCTMSVSGALAAQIAVTERNIIFAKEPGTNGETHFESVMRQMIPSTLGTSLKSTWNAGDSLVIDQSWKLASIYDTNQLAIVSWVQNTSTKEVLQAAYDSPNIVRDAGIQMISGIPTTVCSANADAIFKLHNYAKDPLTSAIINYAIDGGANQTYNWSGNVASGSDTFVKITLNGLTQGTHTITSYSSMPNGAGDLDMVNDASPAISVVVLLTPAASPLMEPFSAVTFPPTNWSLLNLQGDAYAWVRSATGLNGAGSAEINCYFDSAGTIDNLYSPTIDFTSAIAGSAIEFDAAHVQYSANNIERLNVDISSDCGATWTNIYAKADPVLATVAGYGKSAFIPTSTQWRHEKISLDQFIGQASLMARFQDTSGNGNNIYIDNVNISNGVVGIHEVLDDNTVGLYPNPSDGNAYLTFSFDHPKDIDVTVTDILGETLKSYTFKFANGVYQMNLQNHAKGIYFVTIRTNDGVLTKRILISK